MRGSQNDKNMYRIVGWFPSAKQEMGGCGFNIILTPEWKKVVEKSGLTQEKVDALIYNIGEAVLEGHGRDYCMDNVMHYLQIRWGEWGPEHITVPGNACGLDITNTSIGCKEGEACLCPHNVDSISQASMILTLFTTIAEYLGCGIDIKRFES